MKVSPWILAGAMTAPALASPVCGDRQIIASNLFILSSMLPPQGQVATFTAKEKGIDSDGHSAMRSQLDRCGALSAGESVFYRDYGATQMISRAAFKPQNENWQATESMQVTFEGTRLTHGISTIRYETDTQGRIVHKLEQFEIDGKSGESRTVYHFDTHNRLMRSQTTSTHAFFEETREFTWDDSSRLVQVDSAKSTMRLTWDEKGRWSKKEREVKHPFSVQVTVSVCEKWDNDNNCREGSISETEKYAHQSLQTRYTFNHDIQYY